MTQIRHNLKPGSSIVPEKCEARVRQALVETLAPRQFVPGESAAADICINIFGAIEDEISVEDLGGAFGSPDRREWTSAVETALTHGAGETVTTIARGSLVLEVIDPKSTQLLWHAAAMADIVVEVDDAEKYRRTQFAIAEMLRKFPPARL